MKPNTRAKLPAFLMLAATPAAVNLTALTRGPYVATVVGSAVLALAVAGAVDQDPARSAFHGGAPAYWCPALCWLLLAVVAGCTTSRLAEWSTICGGLVLVLAVLGAIVKQR